MSLRPLSIVLMSLAVLAAATVLQAQQTQQAQQTCETGSCSRQVVGQTVVCEPAVQPAPVATWWDNSALGNFWRKCCRDTKRNNCWPQPFVRADRLAVRTAFKRMVDNGTRRENTLGDDYFVPETGKLTRAGQLKIRRILLEGLPSHRSLYVHRAERSAETAARVEAVQQYAAMTVRDGTMPPIYETDIRAPGWPAQLVDTVDTKWNASMPDPRLPARQQSEEESSY